MPSPETANPEGDSYMFSRFPSSRNSYRAEDVPSLARIPGFYYIGNIKMIQVKCAGVAFGYLISSLDKS